MEKKKTVFAPFFWATFHFHPHFLTPQYIHKPHPVGRSSKHSSARSKTAPKNVGFYPFPTPWKILFLPFVDTENTQLLWQTPPCKMHNPEFSYSQIKFRTEIFLAWIHLVCQKLIGFIHLLDSLSNFIKSYIAPTWQKKNIIFCRQTNNFVKSICFLLLEEQIFLFSRRKCFVQSQLDLQN